MFIRTLLGSVLLAAANLAAAAPAVLDFGPVGLMRDARQVRMRFSDDMVALGDSAARDAATISCSGGHQAKGHWIDGRNWVADFADKLPDGVTCDVTPNRIASVKGETLGVAAAWHFNTGGPRAQLIHPYGRDTNAREEPVSIFSPSAPVDGDSLRHLRCSIDKVAAPVTILVGARRDAVIANSQREWERKVDGSWLVAQCGTAPWPNGAAIDWTWGKDISANGVVSALDTHHTLKVRPKLGVAVLCSYQPEGMACDPRGGLTLAFREMVPPATSHSIVVRGSSGASYAVSACETRSRGCSRMSVPGPFQEGETLTVSFTAPLRDVEGREATVAPQTIAVARMLPYVGMVQRNAVMPWTTTSKAVWPIAVRNAEAAITVRSRRLGGAAADIPALLALHRIAESGFSTFVDPAVNDKPYGLSEAMLAQAGAGQPPAIEQTIRPAGPAMEFVGLPLAGHGTWLIEADSALHRTARHQRQVWPDARTVEPALDWERVSLVQLTNLQLHSRLSNQHSSLIWVTAIDTGLPVGAVEVELWSCDGRRLAQTVTDAEGRALFAHMPTAGTCSKSPDSWQRDRSWIVLRKGDDVCILHSGWTESYNSQSTLVGHTILDRVLFQPGETVSAQTLLRDQVPAGFAVPGEFRGKLQIYFENSELVHEEALVVEHGSVNTTWHIPNAAKLGRYRLTIVDGQDRRISDARFNVEEFRRPAFDASLRGDTGWMAGQQQITLAASLRYLAGGAAAGQPVTLRGSYREGAPRPIEGYIFYDAEQVSESLPAFAQRTATLDNAGRATWYLPAPPVDAPVTLHAEMEFADPNGETHIEPVSVLLWPRKHMVGLTARTGVGPGLVRYSVIVLDEKERPLANQRVTIDGAAASLIDYYKLALPIQAADRFEICQVITDAQGKGTCTVPWSRALKQVLLRARADGASTASFVRSADFFNAQSHFPVLELAGAGRPSAGQALTLRVQAPFAPSTALITVEREGVFASSVHHLANLDQQVVLPTELRYAPGVNVVVQLVRGAGPDMAAPQPGQSYGAFHELEVLFDSASHRLQVDLAGASTARPGQHVPFKIKVRHGSVAAAGARVTLLAFDDALTALKPNFTTRVLEAFWRQREIPLVNAELALTWPSSFRLGKAPYHWPAVERAAARELLYLRTGELIEQRDGGSGGTVVVTGLRAVPAASRFSNRADGIVDGIVAADIGRFPDASVTEILQRITGVSLDTSAQATGTPRTDLSGLALWKTDITLEQHGEATIDVPLRDSLTRWRIVAVATDGADRFGTGTAFIQTRKNIQILPGLPPTVRSDDRLRQKLTLRNDSACAVTLQLTAHADIVADPDQPAVTAQLPAAALAARGLQMQRIVSLAAHSNQVVDWTVSVPDRAISLAWTISARVAGSDDGDVVKLNQRVVPALPVTVRDSSMVQVNGTHSMTIAQPLGARPGSGGVAVSWRASLAEAAIAGARSWMAAYPYRCMEQVTSMAVVSDDPAQWDQALQQMSKYMDAQGLLSYFPGTTGSELLTAYVLDIADAAQLKLPAAEKAKMQGALRQALVSKRQNDWLPEHAVLAHRLALQAAIAGSPGAFTPVVPPDLSALPTIALLDWVRYVMTTADTPLRRERLDAAAASLRNRFDIQGTRLVWRGDSSRGAWWMMWTDHVATARTAALVQQWAAFDPRWKEDLPRLMLALVDQQKQGHWDTTVGNAWAVTALRRFERDVERGPVSGVSRAAFGGETSTHAWPNGAPALLPWPQQGARGALELSHEGGGAPWATVRITAAMKGEAPVSHGISVSRAVTPVQQKVPGKWSEGDVMRVTLTFNNAAEFSWLAVTDPIPSGATILGKGLGGESALAQQAPTGERTDWWTTPSYVERGNDSYRAYYQRVLAQTWTVSYVLRLNNAGSFTFPPTRVEALYSPEIFGESPNAPLEVQP